ncbi:hypothetical protein [Litorimonas sp. WD9-15]|uniref:hypothetical protein n=1 Tax=Litorimonas sp. WD9-15 TaxID=3418716 RepID=UPI003D070071
MNIHPIPDPVPVYRAFQLDRTVTIGLIFTVLAQTGAGLIWAGSAAARLAALEQQHAGTADISERLARLEGRTSEMAKSLSRIERELLRDK